MASSITRLDYCQFLLSSQITGIDACQCRRARIRRNTPVAPPWSGCASRLWPTRARNTVCQIKHGMLSQYMIKQLRTPSVRMALA